MNRSRLKEKFWLVVVVRVGRRGGLAKGGSSHLLAAGSRNVVACGKERGRGVAGRATPIVTCARRPGAKFRISQSYASLLFFPPMHRQPPASFLLPLFFLTFVRQCALVDVLFFFPPPGSHPPLLNSRSHGSAQLACIKNSCQQGGRLSAKMETEVEALR